MVIQSVGRIVVAALDCIPIRSNRRSFFHGPVKNNNIIVKEHRNRYGLSDTPIASLRRKSFSGAFSSRSDKNARSLQETYLSEAVNSKLMKIFSKRGMLYTIEK